MTLVTTAHTKTKFQTINYDFFLMRYDKTICRISYVNILKQLKLNSAHATEFLRMYLIF